MLDMRYPILQQTLTVSQVGTQFNYLTFGPKACAQKTEGVKSLQPLRIIDVGVATGHVFGIARIDEEHYKPTSVKELKDRDPIEVAPPWVSTLSRSLGKINPVQ
ncbi:hypothetical protein ACVI1I_006396 [Bradyrhizobium sp. USDA 4459]